jgi:hypothetical protein
MSVNEARPENFVVDRISDVLEIIEIQFVEFTDNLLCKTC